MIRRVLYDEERRELCVWFRDSVKYTYRSVPRALYDELCAAPSAGRYFNARIRGRYPCSHDPERRRFRPALQD
jgi:lysyl-tRNA synthetase class 2